MKKSILTFISVTFGLSWLIQLICYLAGVRYSDGAYSIVNMVIMFIPTLGMIAARYFCHEGLYFDELCIAPNFRGNIKRYLFAYIFPALAVLLGAVTFFMLFPEKSDTSAQTYLHAMVDAGYDVNDAGSILTGQMAMTVILGPIANILLTFIEELGFRGYLLVKFNKFFKKNSAIKAAFITSLIWGIWYIPMYLQGHNYGLGYPGSPFLGILMGLLFNILIGIIVSYLAFKTGSVIAGALIRSGISAMAVLPLYFSKGDIALLLGPGVYGIVGCVGIALFALVYALRIIRMQRTGELFYTKKEPKSKRNVKSNRKKEEF